MTFSRKIIRLFKKHFETEDVEQVLASTGTDAPRFAAVIGSIEESFRESDDRLKTAIRNLEISSSELNDANLQLERLNLSINAILESQGQGLLFCDRDGICSPVYSRACLTLLEKDPAHKHIAEVLALDAAAAERMKSVIDLIFSHGMNALSFEDMTALAPKTYSHSKGLAISLEYKAMYNPSGAITGIQVTATDVTKEIEARKKLERKEKDLLRTMRIVRNRAGYGRFIQGFEAVFATIGNTSSLAQVKRELHTLKGMSRVFHLDELAALLHEMEDKIGDERPDDLQMAYAASAMSLLEDAKKHGRDLWGNDFLKTGDLMAVPTDKIAAFANEIKRTGQDALALSYFQSIASVPAETMFSSFGMQVEYFAELSGKQVSFRCTNDDGVCLAPYAYRDFLDSLIHVARNIIDHAIEGKETRRALKKPETARVTVDIRHADKDRRNVNITIHDDGGGLDTEKIRARLSDMMQGGGVDRLGDEDVWQNIFDDHFSTRDAADINAGRGIGLSAVKHAVEGLSGTVRVTSREAHGTTLHITLPVVF